MVVAIGLLLISPITEAEQKVYKIGFLWGLPPSAELTTAFDKGLADLGWVEGKNIVVEHLSADGHFDRLPGLCAELVAHGAELIVLRSRHLKRSPPGRRRAAFQSFSSFTEIRCLPVIFKASHILEERLPGSRRCIPT